MWLKAIIISGKYLNSWTVKFPSGKTIECKNYATASFYKNKYNKRLKEKLNDMEF